jgi:hypothetical protein
MAEDVTHTTVQAVADRRYAPRAVGLGPRAVVTGMVTVAAGTAIVLASTRAPGSSPTNAPATPVAYVGSHPRLAVDVLPPGFAPGPDVPVSTLPGQPPQPGQLPSKTFVKGTGADEESIIVAEGTDGVGPVPKLLAFAQEHPSIVSSVTEDGQAMTVVNLAALDAGSNAVIYFPVGESSWALIGGSPNVPLSDLLAVAAAVSEDGS